MARADFGAVLMINGPGRSVLTTDYSGLRSLVNHDPQSAVWQQIVTVETWDKIYEHIPRMASNTWLVGELTPAKGSVDWHFGDYVYNLQVVDETLWVGVWQSSELHKIADGPVDTFMDIVRRWLEDPVL